MISLKDIEDVVENYSIPSFDEMQSFLVTLCCHDEKELSIVEEVKNDGK